jgi:hypothetical protein
MVDIRRIHVQLLFRRLHVKWGDIVDTGVKKTVKKISVWADPTRHVVGRRAAPPSDPPPIPSVKEVVSNLIRNRQ